MTQRADIYKNVIKVTRQENKQLKEDIKNIKIENNEQLKRFQEENNSLKKNKQFGKGIRKKDKKERKNNIIIKSTDLEGPELKQQIRKYLKNKLEVETEVEKAREIGNIKEGVLLL